jgi:trehalose 6-phosphate phosphatase
VIGVDRGGQREALREHGADVVFSDLCRIAVEPGPRSRTATPPPALGGSGIEPDVLRGRRAVLFLDYDGTLTPIVERPEDASALREMREDPGDAARAMPVAIISGRDLPDVRRLVGLPQMIYAGSHGFDIEGPDLRLELPEGVDALGRSGAGRRGTRGASLRDRWGRLERKRFAIDGPLPPAVAESRRPRVEAAVDAVQRATFEPAQAPAARRSSSCARTSTGTRGGRCDWLLAELGLDSPDTVPLYIGDDLTDEDAFERPARAGHRHPRGGASPELSAADYRIDDDTASGTCCSGTWSTRRPR